MKNYTCTVTVTYCGNNFEAETREEYIQKVKNLYCEEFDLYLDDSEISEIEERAE